MKKLAVLMLSLAFALSFGLTFAQSSDIYTVVTKTDGSTYTVEGISEKNSNISSYSVFAGDTQLISVSLHNSVDDSLASLSGKARQNSYYSTEFVVDADENTSCFLTGLTQDNVEQVKQEILYCIQNGTKFDFEHVDFIDAEKTMSDENDDELCWAAATSNILHYTGWGQQAGFSSEDEMFQAFIDNFDNKGGNPIYALPWFFDGSYALSGQWNGSRPTTQGSGGYLNEYCIDNIIDYNNCLQQNTFYKIPERLKAGCGVCLDVEFFSKTTGQRAGGHSLSLWGYVADGDCQPEQFGYLTKLFLSDSDSHKNGDYDNRDQAPNHLLMVTATPSNALGVTTYSLEDYSSINFSFVEDFTTLAPYSSSIPKEDGTDCTLDRTQSCDITVSVSTALPNYTLENASYAAADSFANDDLVYAMMKIQNKGMVVFAGRIDYTVEVIDSATDLVVNSSRGALNTSIANEVYLTLPVLMYDSLPQGSYQMKIAVSISEAEAYLSNNVAYKEFSVSPDSANRPRKTFARAEIVGEDLQYHFWSTQELNGANAVVACFDESGVLMDLMVYGLNISVSFGRYFILPYATGAHRVEVMLVEDFYGFNISPLCNKASATVEA